MYQNMPMVAYRDWNLNDLHHSFFENLSATPFKNEAAFFAPSAAFLAPSIACFAPSIAPSMPVSSARTGGAFVLGGGVGESFHSTPTCSSVCASSL